MLFHSLCHNRAITYISAVVSPVDLQILYVSVRTHFSSFFPKCAGFFQPFPVIFRNIFAEIIRRYPKSEPGVSKFFHLLRERLKTFIRSKSGNLRKFACVRNKRAERGVVGIFFMSNALCDVPAVVKHDKHILTNTFRMKVENSFFAEKKLASKSVTHVLRSDCIGIYGTIPCFLRRPGAVIVINYFFIYRLQCCIQLQTPPYFYML